MTPGEPGEKRGRDVLDICSLSVSERERGGNVEGGRSGEDEYHSPFYLSFSGEVVYYSFVLFIIFFHKTTFLFL